MSGNNRDDDDIVASAEDAPEAIPDDKIEDVNGGWAFGSFTHKVSQQAVNMDTIYAGGDVMDTIYAGGEAMDIIGPKVFPGLGGRKGR